MKIKSRLIAIVMATLFGSAVIFSGSVLASDCSKSNSSSEDIVLDDYMSEDPQ